MGAFGGRAEVMDQLAPLGPVYQAGTLSGNPLAMAAGIASLQMLAELKPYARLDALGRQVCTTALAAAKANLPMVVPGHEDSTFGNIFASHVKFGDFSASIVKSGIEYMARFYDDYAVLSKGKGVGFFQIGGGISGDFPICVVPSIKYDLQAPVKPWAYFC